MDTTSPPDRSKYPRTPHLPWSPGATLDDVRSNSVTQFEGREVVVTAKMDGECSKIYSDGYTHARSIDSKMHPSRAHMRALAARVGQEGMPRRLSLAGENCYALHSLWYDRLPAYFMVFGAYMGDECLSWDDTLEWCEMLDLTPVPVLYRGVWDEAAVKACMPPGSAGAGASTCASDPLTARKRWDVLGHRADRFAVGQEGYVVRVASAFPTALFGERCAKFVRKNHVTCTDEHWAKEAVIPNLLAPLPGRNTS